MKRTTVPGATLARITGGIVTVTVWLLVMVGMFQITRVRGLHELGGLLASPRALC